MEKRQETNLPSEVIKKLKPVIIISIVIVIVIFGLLVTETIDLKDNSSSVRQYTDLKQRQNQWIADTCSDVLCSNGKSVTEMIAEFIEENKNQFDKNGLNMYGFDKNGFNNRGITHIQSEIIRENYILCTAGIQDSDHCVQYSDGLCAVSASSMQYAGCDQQSKIMTSQFVLENKGE